MDTTLSADAVEALAKSLAVKLGIKDKTDADLADQMLAFHVADKKRAEADEAFRKEVTDALKELRRNKSDLPFMAISAAIVASLFSVLSLVWCARTADRLSNEIREIREHMVPDGRSAR